MKQYTIYQADAFTRNKFKGNPAGVVLDANALTPQQMQLIARELNNSETAFLCNPENDDCDGVIRYFTPRQEVPICGHATVAAMHVKTVEENLSSQIFRMKTGAGILPFEVQRTSDRIRIIMTQGRIEISPAIAPDMQKQIYESLGLIQEEIDPRCPVQIASTGHSKIMVGIRSRKKLNALQPDMAKLAKLSATIGSNGYFVFTLDSDSPEILCYGRMFAPAIGIAEDPVTGNANGPLGAYLLHNGIVAPPSQGPFTFSARQGEAIQREGTVNVSVDLKQGKPHRVQISGEAVIVFKTTIEI